ncbi:DNA starvation/stationary phase protection protein [Lysinibacter sp. HNR]|uniref:Dps family protein n=1 Tax=Lysinibacter sp. HNR TaxID=3031408 RepID=UPI00243573F6|nr:DNA starvation/stationary phase protection protein [Lysinibacter sp. HNR]WGD38338.1 DNA starvation/stationary phase protection protein [Lysinibacter sp. HNR]
MTQATPTTVQAVTNSDAASGTSQFLSPVVVELTALAVNAKQAHWHIRGTAFIAVHELLDSIVSHAQEFADLAAERIIALGLPLDGRIRTVAEKTKTADLSAGFQPADVVIREMIAQLDTAIATVNTAVTELDDIDLVSQDVAIAIAQGLDKDRWFLFAHISE